MASQGRPAGEFEGPKSHYLELATQEDVKGLATALRKTRDIDYMHTVCTPPTAPEVQRAAADAVRGDLSNAGVKPDSLNLHTLISALEPASAAASDSQSPAQALSAAAQRNPGRGWVRGAAQVLQALSEAANETAADYDEHLSHPTSSPPTATSTLRRKGSARAGAPGVLDPLPDTHVDAARKQGQRDKSSATQPILRGGSAAGGASRSGAPGSTSASAQQAGSAVGPPAETKEEKKRRKKREKRKKKRSAALTSGAATAAAEPAASATAAAAAAPEGPGAGDDTSTESRASSQSLDTPYAAPALSADMEDTPTLSSSGPAILYMAPPQLLMSVPVVQDIGSAQTGSGSGSSLRGLVSLSHDKKLCAISAPISTADAATVAVCAAADAEITDSAMSEPLLASTLGHPQTHALTHPSYAATSVPVSAFPSAAMRAVTSVGRAAAASQTPASPSALPSPFCSESLVPAPDDTHAHTLASLVSHPVCITPANTAVTSEYPSRQGTTDTSWSAVAAVPVHVAAAAALAQVTEVPVAGASSGNSDMDKPATVDVSAIEEAGRQRAAEGGADYQKRAAAQTMLDTLVQTGEKAAGLVAIANKAGLPVSSIDPVPGLRGMSPPPTAVPALDARMVEETFADALEQPMGTTAGEEERLEAILEYAGGAASKAGDVVKDLFSAAADALKDASAGLVGGTQDALQEAKAQLGGISAPGPLRTPEATTGTSTAAAPNALLSVIEAAEVAISKLADAGTDVVDYMSEVPEAGNPFHVPIEERSPNVSAANAAEVVAEQRGKVPASSQTAPSQALVGSAPGSASMHGKAVAETAYPGAAEPPHHSVGEIVGGGLHGMGQQLRGVGERVRDAVVDAGGWLDVPKEVGAEPYMSPPSVPHTGHVPRGPSPPLSEEVSAVSHTPEHVSGASPDVGARALEAHKVDIKGGGAAVPAAWLSEIDEGVVSGAQDITAHAAEAADAVGDEAGVDWEPVGVLGGESATMHSSVPPSVKNELKVCQPQPRFGSLFSAMQRAVSGGAD